MNIRELIKEEWHKLVQDSQKDYSKIEGKLESLRKKLLKDTETESPRFEDKQVAGRRIDLQTVCDIIDIPRNDLMLYFLNCVKIKNERSLVEYHLGHVWFYEEAPKGK